MARSMDMLPDSGVNFMVQATAAERMERERREALAVDPDYSCGAAYCDDPACNTHGPKAFES